MMQSSSRGPLPTSDSDHSADDCQQETPTTSSRQVPSTEPRPVLSRCSPPPDCTPHAGTVSHSRFALTPACSPPSHGPRRVAGAGAEKAVYERGTRGRGRFVASLTVRRSRGRRHAPRTGVVVTLPTAGDGAMEGTEVWDGGMGGWSVHVYSYMLSSATVTVL